MANLLERFRNLVSAPYDDEEYEDDYIDEDEYYEEPEPNPAPRAFAPARKKPTSRDKVVSINTSVNMQVVVSYPMTIEEAADCCKHLQERKTIVINLEKTEAEVAQRISDFLCGAGFALDCSIQSISDEIFIICPANVKITGEFKQELAANGIKIPTANLWRS